MRVEERKISSFTHFYFYAFLGKPAPIENKAIRKYTPGITFPERIECKGNENTPAHQVKPYPERRGNNWKQRLYKSSN